ncbi:MAG: hypothetical protein KL787_09970 [Taibaiella sp.]|nr:hypothetical protein [Taibaiella sp.]
MKLSKGTKKSVIVSKRCRVRLNSEELEKLNIYTRENKTAFSNIKLNTNIHRDTILRTIERGWLEAKPAIKLRDFLKMI